MVGFKGRRSGNAVPPINLVATGEPVSVGNTWAEKRKKRSDWAPRENTYKNLSGGRVKIHGPVGTRRSRREFLGRRPVEKGGKGRERPVCGGIFKKLETETMNILRKKKSGTYGGKGGRVEPGTQRSSILTWISPKIRFD